MSMQVGSVDSWERFNSAVNAAKSRTTANPATNTTVASSRGDAAPLSLKAYGSERSTVANSVIKGTKFDAYA